MTAIFADRVRETTTSTGAGNLALAGAVTGYRSFNAAFGTGGGDLFWYVIEAVDSSGVPTGAYEMGTGHLADATTLVRDTVVLSTNANAAYNFGSGTKLVMCDVPAAVMNAIVGGIGTFPEASAAQFLASASGKALSADKVWASAAFVTLTDSGTIAVDLAAFINASVTLGGNRTLGNPSNTKPGQTGAIRIVQDGIGSRTLAYASNWKFAGGSAPVLSTAAGAVDMLFYQVVSSTVIFATLIKDVK